ncbi:MAG: Rieske (2Fe-2S) protein [Firmicutes bacterium]|nr:Rieske (2Fe-2S) protein [Bacillota bacterium]
MYQRVASLKELKEKNMIRVELEGTAILLTIRNDQVFAIGDKCPHLGASLAKGSLSDGIVTCSKHHAQIDVTNGELVGSPKILFLKVPAKNAKTYPTKVEEDHILVGI